ncbi:MAG TPA: toprim domain-containing protein [Streptosporangiaceae bacterium]|jgi:DNA primase
MPANQGPRRRGPSPSRIADLRRQAADQAETLSSGDDWLRLLRYAEHFDEYGGTNILLILRDRPHATRLATYEQWKRDGHPVRRKAHGITLLDPSDPRQAIRSFDITQTGRPPVDGPLAHLRPARLTPADLFTALTSIAMRKGFDIVRQRSQESARTSRIERSIYLHPALTDEAACYALAHELAHVQLDDIPDGACHGARLVAAESVAYLICRHAGIDVTPFTFPAPPTWAGRDPRNNRGQTTTDAIERITHAANAITRQADAISRGRSPALHPIPVPATQAEMATSASSSQPDEAPPDVSPAAQAEQATRDRLIEIHRQAEGFFVNQLPGSWVPGNLAARGLGAALDDGTPWHIGYAPATWTALVDHLRTAGFTDDEIIASGLGKRSRTGGLIDRFRDRATIPVRTPDGTTIAFIARANPDAPASDGHPIPKYLNSPQTNLYTKGTVLFGLDTALPRLTSGATPIIVEGTLDAIAIHLADADGRYAPVAPSGTALTREQVAALTRTVDLSERGALVAFDGDDAGQRAAVRAHELLRGHTDHLLHARLAPGDDPAGLLETHGPEHLLAALRERAPLAAAVLAEQLAISRDRPEWERREHAAHVIARLVPDNAARRIAQANLPGPRTAPENAAPLDPATTASLLPGTTNHLIHQTATDIGITHCEVLIAVADAISEAWAGTTTEPAEAASSQISPAEVTAAGIGLGDHQPDTEHPAETQTPAAAPPAAHAPGPR